MGEEKTQYEMLIPNKAVENKAEDALKFALTNKDLNNIAITGQYSSGKSSVIESYFGKYIKEKEYLNISLATFEKKEDCNNINKESNSLEKIIIEKIYYSTLKKYEKQENIKNSVITGFIVAFINMLIYLINAELINNSLINNLYFTICFIILEIICMTGALSFLISYVMGLQKIKLKVGNIEVEVNQGNDKETNRNLLNEEIDFIVKTMNVAKYKYIVFEDLDRFQNPRIFERLRDLNITLNSTLKQKVKFIYAIKDEMFIADNRTKFFDFIIPIVPYVSYENSGEELLKIIKKYGLDIELSEDFILDISLFISDMRILKNTVNEYIIYKKTLDKKLPDYESLFSILLYKNTCSEDFAKLQNKDGEIYNCFVNKNKKYIKDAKENLNEKIKEYNEIEKYLISKNSIKALAIYNIQNTAQEDYSITLKNATTGTQLNIKHGINVEEIPDDLLFFPDTTIKCVYQGNWITENLSQFLKEKCSVFFEEYELFKVGVNNKKENISNEIEMIRKELENSKEYTLSELSQKYKETINIDLGCYSELIKYLLANGYINENYNIYINRFHEGSITENDYNFIMNVKNGKENDYKTKLDNSMKIIKRLRYAEFKKEEVLNISILDDLLENDENIEKRDLFFNTLIRSSKYIEIIKYCICDFIEIKNKNKIIQKICLLDKDILKKVREAKIQNKYKNIILENIIIITEAKVVKELNTLEDMIKYVEDNSLLKGFNVENVKNTIEEFNIKYNNITEFINNPELYEYIINHNNFKINYDNIFNILQYKEKEKKNEIELKNYEKIVCSEILQKYINDNIQYYVENVYNMLQQKQENSLEIVKRLINNQDIKFDSKKEIIKKETTKIDDILNIENEKLWKDIFEADLIEIEWNNINSYYNKFGLDKNLINIFNNIEKIKNILTKENDIIDEESNSNLVQDLLLANDLNIEAYDFIIEKSELNLVEAKINELNKTKLLRLINKKRIEYNNNMLEEIRSYSTDTLIEYIKHNYTYIHNKIDKGELLFDLEEINIILQSGLTCSIKNKCIKMITDEKVEEMSVDLADNIAKVSIKNKFSNILSENALLKVILGVKDNVVRIRLINLNFDVVTKENILEILSKLGTNYKKIVINKNRPRFNKNQEIIELLENIKKLGYNIKYIENDNYIILSNTIR